jgi:hypothetical protein
MKVKLTLLLATLIMLAWASPAQARMARVCSVKQSASAELRCGKVNLWHATSLERFLLQHTTAGTRQDRQSLWRDAAWLRKYAEYHIANAQQRVRPRINMYSAWMCIHSHEGSWTDSGDPYWGGLQMDRGFMTTYAPRWLLRRGWANRWSPAEQMMVAERAYSSGRGFWPWPNTARMCGLL